MKISDFHIYHFRDFMQEDFPFKMEIRDYNSLSREKHGHEHFQICYISKGTCMHFVDKRNFVLVKGDIFCIPPNMGHDLRTIEGKEIELVQLDFMPAFIDSNMKELSRIDSFIDFILIQPVAELNDEMVSKLNISAPGQILAENLISDISEELKTKQDGYKISIKSSLLKLLVIIGREYKQFLKENKSSQIINTMRKSLFDSIDYIDNNYNESLTLEDMALKANISPTYYCHMFKLVKKETFTEYLNSLRVRKAMELIKETDEKITEICFEIGYNNVGHFNRMFKKIVGITPSEYKKGISSQGVGCGGMNI